MLAAPFLLNGGAGLKVYKRIGRVLSRKAASGVGSEESGADFFFGACSQLMLLPLPNYPSSAAHVMSEGLNF